MQAAAILFLAGSAVAATPPTSGSPSIELLEYIAGLEQTGEGELIGPLEMDEIEPENQPKPRKTRAEKNE